MARLVPPVIEAGTLATQEQPAIAVDDGLTLRCCEEADVAVVRVAFEGLAGTRGTREAPTAALRGEGEPPDPA